MNDPQKERREPPADLEMRLGQAMYTQRATRRLKPDAIPDSTVASILDAATQAPSGANQQPARFLVIRDAELRRRFGALYFEAWWAKRRDHQGWKTKADIPADDTNHQLAAVLADEIGEAPVIVLVLARGADWGHSVYPSVQNLLLAARAYGVGSVLTILHPDVLERVFDLFEIPKDWHLYCCIPLGYPRGSFGPTSRLPHSAVSFSDQWGQPFDTSSDEN